MEPESSYPRTDGCDRGRAVNEYERGYREHPQMIVRRGGTLNAASGYKSKRQIDRQRRRAGKRTFDEARTAAFEAFLGVGSEQDQRTGGEASQQGGAGEAGAVPPASEGVVDDLSAGGDGHHGGDGEHGDLGCSHGVVQRDSNPSLG